MPNSKFSRRSLLAVSLIGGLAFLGGCAASAHPQPVVVAAKTPAAVIYVKPAPPKHRPHHAKPPRPGPRYVWIDGRWKWDGHRYVWVQGRWAKPPKHRRHWVSGQWKKTRHGWHWVPGHWR